MHSRPAAKAHSRDLSTARLVFQRCIQRVAPRGRRILWVLAALRKSSPVARRACCARSPRPASAAPQHRLFLRLSQRHLQSRGRRQCLRIWVCGRRLFRVCGRRALPLRPAPISGLRPASSSTAAGCLRKRPAAAPRAPAAAPAVYDLLQRRPKARDPRAARRLVCSLASRSLHLFWFRGRRRQLLFCAGGRLL